MDMLRLSRLVIALVGATALMAAVVGSASARSLSTSNQNIRAVWNPLTFTEPFGGSVRCPVTLEGSLHSRTIVKGIYNLIGYITRAAVGAPATCTGGEATILQETLPWHVRYNGFAGTLPNITRVLTLISGASFRVRVNASGATCLFRTTDAEHAAGIFTRNTTTGELTSAEVGGEITSTEGCAFGARVRGRLSGTTTSLTLLGTTARITVTLI
jgi:hypothetical protein